MLLQMLKGKIHRAAVTKADLNYEGSIGVDTQLLEASGILPNEAVHVWNITNGERFETYALALEAGSGAIQVNGAAARLSQPGDLVIIAAFCWMDEKEAQQHQPKVILVDEKNRIAK
jgi:aspartate 1-decarboxylase